ncbi:D-glycerate 3-kinase, partial [Ephemerocybe angulata]
IATMSSLSIAANFILDQLTGCLARPLIAGIQGPQGSGKTFLASHLVQRLAASDSNLRMVVLSIDDLYLPHSGLQAVARSHPENPLLRGRGQPGTHDVQLGLDLLTALHEGRTKVRLPSFDKSLFDGEGDRLPMDDRRVVVVEPPAVDVIVLEGWFIGFQPISPELLDEKWERVWKREEARLGIPEGFCTKSNIAELNQNLVEYQALWDRLDIFIQASLSPIEPEDDEDSPYSIIYQWRLEQEHAMKALNGNRGMADEAVRQ